MENAAEFAILIVEDEAIIALDLQDLIEDAGAGTVSLATSIPEALSMIERRRFDFALIDIQVGPRSGLEVARALTMQGVRYVFTSGYRPAEDVDEEFRSVPVLDKPVGSDRLLDVIRTERARTTEPAAEARTGADAIE